MVICSGSDMEIAQDKQTTVRSDSVREGEARLASLTVRVSNGLAFGGVSRKCVVRGGWMRLCSAGTERLLDPWKLWRTPVGESGVVAQLMPDA
jgi:hypothetical protein